MDLDKLKSRIEKVKAEIFFEDKQRKELFIELERYGVKSIEQAEKYILEIQEEIEQLIIKEKTALNSARQLMGNIEDV